MYALAPPHRRYDRDGPVVRRGDSRRRGSYLGQRTLSFAFTAPPGFVLAQRLAHMLDSLVRVSRRVGQGTDRFATDAESTPRHPPGERSRLEGTGDSPPSSNDRPRARQEADREGLPRSAGRPTRTGPITPRPKSWSPCPEASDCQRTGRGAPSAESAPTATRFDRDETAVRRATPLPPRGLRVESDGRTLRSSPFASRRFHVLLNSLFKVLFNFPSRYLCAIGLVSVFSLRWSLPPALGCNLKQPDS